MAWYRLGTVSVTGGSPNVTGAGGTLWLSYAKNGDGMLLPDGKVYEVLDVVDNTHITLATNYGGSTASGQAYGLFPTHAYSIQLASQVTQLIADYSSYVTGPGAGKFDSGTVAAPGMSWASDTDTGFYLYGANTISAATAGVERLRINATGVSTFYAAAGVFGDGRSLLTVADTTAMAAGVGGGIAFTGNVNTGQTDAATQLATIHATKENGTSGSTLSALVFTTRSGASPAEAFRVDSSRNMAIGHKLAGHGRLSVSAGLSGANGSSTTADSTMVVEKYVGTVTDAATGYVALCEKYTTGSVVASGFDGVISAYRGHTTAGNVLERVRVAIKSAYTSNILQELAGNRGLVEFDYAGTTYIGINLGVGASRDIYARGRFWKFSPFLVQDAQASNVVALHSASEFRALGSSAIVVVAGGTAATFDSNRNLLVGVGAATGDAKIQVSNGVRFGSTLSTDANTLDYYEEGTFTPTVVGLTTAGAGTYTTQLGRYTRTGNRVHFSINLAWTAHTGTGDMAINGLPFTSTPVSGAAWVCPARFDNLTFSGQLAAVVGSASTQVQLRQMSSGATASAPALDTAALLNITGTYEV